MIAATRWLPASSVKSFLFSYAADAPLPWRWVRDELRAGPDGVVVAMTFVDLPGLRRLGGTPFLLTPRSVGSCPA